jgi:hypothetical protein
MKNRQITVRSTSKTMPAVIYLELTSNDAEQQDVAPKRTPSDAHQSRYRLDIAQSRHHHTDVLVRELEMLTNQCQQLIGTV